MNRVALAVFAACLVATPALAQATFSVGVGNESGGSTATVTTTQTAPVFTGDYSGANVLTGVNVRSGPSNGAQILGTLRQGGTVMARCQRGWCELQDGGYVGQKFLTFDASGSFDVLQPPAAGAPSTGEAGPTETATAAMTGTDSTTNLAPPTSAGSVSANFGGNWSVTNDPSGEAVPLTLAQTGESVTGTLQGKSRVTKLTGDVEGTKLSFTYQMVNAKGAQVATGNGFLTLTTGGQALTGALMLNGLVIANINAVR